MSGTASTSHEMTRTYRVPGAEGLLVFLMMDMLFFGLMLTAFAFGRVGETSMYDTSRRALDANLGMANTMVLLTSSWAVALAVRAAARGDTRTHSLGLLLAISLGLVFIAIKLHEYRTKIDAGISMVTNDFFTWYFAITGLHFLHVVGGLVALGIVLRGSRVRPDGPLKSLESVGLFWHMVDLLWVMLFPIVYLI